MNKVDFDLVIIGAGPAGSVAAINLLNQGYRVLLIDKAKFPRDKPCGGGISIRLLERFPYLIGDLKRISVNYVRRIRLESPSGYVVTASRSDPLYLMIRRCDFDTMLVEICKRGGITVRESMMITKILYKPDYVEIVARDGTVMRAKMIIGADSVNSVVAKSAGLIRTWSPEQVALDMMEETSYANLNFNARDTMHVYYGFQKAIGYGYIFPKENHINLGVGFLLSFFKERIGGRPYKSHCAFVDFLIREKIVKGESHPENFMAYLIPVGGPLQRTYADRTLLCGDAAGFVNAFTAEGIYYAMVSGELAAKTALASLSRDIYSRDFLAQYQGLWEKEFGNELRSAVKIQKILFADMSRIDRVVKAAAQNKRLGSLLTDFATGNLDYSTLKKKLLFHFFGFYLKYKIRKYVPWKY